MTPLLANAGVPMLFVQMPLLLAALPVVVALEAWLCRRWLGVPWGLAWKGAGAANAISTIVGFPMLWVGLVVIQMALGAGGVPKLPEPWFSVYTVTVQAPWLLPFEDRLYCMIPVACLVLLIPAFFVTVLIERAVYRGAFGETSGSMSLKRAAWSMHCVTYGLLFVIGLCLLASSLVSHQSHPDDSPSGSPGERLGNSEAHGGPSSMSWSVIWQG